MQNFILTTLILGLAFFLYLISTGEIDSKDFNIRKIQGSVKFEITKSEVSKLDKSSTVKLNIRGTMYTIYTFTGSEFTHIPRSEYYLKKYNIPLEAKDAVTGTWLGSRYIFYVIEEEYGGSESEMQYHVYKSEYQTDSNALVEYIRFKTIRGLDVSNALEVKY